ncbi:MAG: cache domain-containing protein [Spirochaetales bacterium]|nr:cache domain-containing protein [Spirochaetales bacterium]MBR6201001.1 cache domain-containing protein [Spirochaetales bacterium]
MSDSKKHLPISVLLMAFIALGVITSSVITGFIAIKLFHNEQTEQDEADLVRTAEGVNNTLEDYLETLTGCATILARHPDFIRQTLSLLREDEVDADLLENTSETLDIELMAIVGTNAKILNGYGLSDGIDVSDVAAVSHTLQTQESFLSYEDIGEATFAMLASQPIYNDNNMIGVLIVGYDLAADDFISGIHANYNVDCTIFRETTRVATTLTGIGGKSLIGTKLDNQAIIRQVLNDGVQFVGTNMINGKKYSSIYSPLKSSDDSISGMIFVAKEFIPISQNSTAKAIMLAILVLTIIFIIGGFFITKWILGRVHNVTKYLKDMATGEANLTRRIQSTRNDELGSLFVSFNNFCEKLRNMINQIKTSETELRFSGKQMSHHAEGTAMEIAQIIETISTIHQQIDGQATAIHDTAGAVNEISANIESLERMISSQSGSVADASTAVEQMIGNIRSVNNSVETMVSSFEELEHNAALGISTQEDVNEKIRQIESQSEMLQEANATINNIADQTNLLAMNAAIEAAHAGDAGNGFAIVADEIRKLSETSAAQSQTIGQQLNNIKASIHDVVTASTESANVFSSVADNIKTTTQLVMEIRAAMEEQNTGNHQISEALKVMNNSTSEVSNAAQEMTEGNKAILQNMQDLQNSTYQIKDSMQEMGIGADKINKSGIELTDIARLVEESINKIGDQIDAFTV